MIRKIFIVLLLLAPLTTLQSQNTVIDKIIAIVGSEPILYSDLETQYIQYLMQQGRVFDDPEIRCALLEELMIQKLMLNKAIADSIIIADRQVIANIENKMNYYIMQMGSKEEFEEYYGKTVEEFKAEFFDITKEQMMIERVQHSLTEDISVTPAQVRRFFRDIPKDSLPMIPAEYEIGHIVKIPDVRPEEQERIIGQLNNLKQRVIDGEDFGILARINSKDPGTASKGGLLSFGRGVMDPAFEAAAFALKNPEDISDVVKSSFGYHIIKLVRRSGDYITVRHILMIPEAHPADLRKAEKDLNNIKALIEMDTISFEDAALKFSDHPSARNAGRMINPRTGSAVFTKETLDPAIAHVVDRLDEGQLSKPVIMITDDGRKAFRIIYLFRKVESHIIDLEQDYDKVRNFALQAEKMNALDKWISNKIETTYIKLLDDNHKSCDFSFEWFEN